MTSSFKLPTTIVSADALLLIPWIDHRTDASGHDPRSVYVEQFWLGTLGPSTTWFLRHCATLLDDADSTVASLRETASTLGIGHEGGIRSAMMKTVARACRFRAARPVGSATLAIRLLLPQLSHRQLQRLPALQQRRHEEFTAVRLNPDPSDPQQDRARRLAMILVECGESFSETESQLARFRFHPAVASEAVHRAWSQHHGRTSPEACLTPHSAHPTGGQDLAPRGKVDVM